MLALVAIAAMVQPDARAEVLPIATRAATAALASLPGAPGSAAAAPGRPGRADERGVTCAMLPAGIRQQESGGNYAVRGRPVASHGGARALGAYQVMPANLGPWSRELLGRTVSEPEYMASPRLQDQLAGRKLAQLCAAHGPRGAAAAWFSGRWWLHNDTAARGGGAASVKSYTDNVMALSRRYGR